MTSGRAAEAPSRRNPAASSQPGTTAGGKLFTPAELAQARLEVVRAFQICNLVDNGQFICPNCHTSSKGKVKVYPHDGGWKCRKCGTAATKETFPVQLVMKIGGYDFVTAVCLLLDKPVPVRTGSAPRPAVPARVFEPLAVESVTSVCDKDVYREILTFQEAANLAAAQRYYGQWHIDPETIEENRGRFVVDVRAMQQHLVAKFGMERIIACGVAKQDEGKRPFWFLSVDYPIVEPHLNADGDPVYMQFRCSPRVQKQYQAHKAWTRYKKWAAYEEYLKWLAQGNIGPSPVPHASPAPAVPEAKYVPKFLSLRGAAQETQIGYGIHRLAELKAQGIRAVVVWAEGCKDHYAGATIGRKPTWQGPFESFGIAGVQHMPPKWVMEILAFHENRIALDPDSAGDIGRQRALAHCAEYGAPAQLVDVKSDLDVADRLQQQHKERPREGCPWCRQAAHAQASDSAREFPGALAA